jgi:hypothetical protein
VANGRALRGLALLGLLTIGSSACEPRPGELREQWEQGNERFRVRVQVFDEGNKAHLFEPGCHLRIASAQAGSDAWRRFGNAYFSKCDQRFKDRVRFVNERVGYVFMQWWYTVTVDGAGAGRHGTCPRTCRAGRSTARSSFDDVSIKPDGTGTMTLNPAGMAGKQPLTLYTGDLASPGVPSWNQILSFLQQMAQLREIAGSAA